MPKPMKTKVAKCDLEVIPRTFATSVEVFDSFRFSPNGSGFKGMRSLRLVQPLVLFLKVARSIAVLAGD